MVAVGVEDVDAVFLFQEVGVFDALPRLAAVVEVDVEILDVELESAPSGFGDVFNHFFVEGHAVFVIFVSGVGLKGDVLGEVFVVDAFVAEAGADVKDFFEAAAEETLQRKFVGDS